VLSPQTSPSSLLVISGQNNRRLQADYAILRWCEFALQFLTSAMAFEGRDNFHVLWHMAERPLQSIV
jgi:hypothetical protein